MQSTQTRTVAEYEAIEGARAPIIRALAAGHDSIPAICGAEPTVSVSVAAATLTLLEMDGQVTRSPGDHYMLTPEARERADRRDPNEFAHRQFYSEIRLSHIDVTGMNPRKHFDPAALAELAASIREHGVLEPVIVRDKVRAPGDYEERYELIAGERRVRAAGMAGLTRIPSIVRQVSDDPELLGLMLVENLHREAVDPVAEANAYAQLAELGFSQARIADLVGKRQPAIASWLRLRRLPQAVQDLVATGKLSASHGVALGSYQDMPAFQLALAELCVKREIPVRQLEGNLANLGNEVVAELVKVGAVREVRYGEPYRTVCAECPLAAYRETSHYYRICLRPDHYEQIGLEYKAQQQEKATAAVEQARAADPTADLQVLADMPYESYERIRYQAVAGCTKDCPCRGRAVEADGAIVEICVDPKRRAKLVQQQNREKNKRIRESTRSVVQQAIDRIRTAPDHDAHTAAVALFGVIQSGWGDSLSRALAAVGIPVEPTTLKDHSYSATFGKTMQTLASLSSSAQLRLAAATIIMGEQIAQERETSHGTPYTTWYAELPAPDPAGAAPEQGELANLRAAVESYRSSAREQSEKIAILSQALSRSTNNQSVSKLQSDLAKERTERDKAATEALNLRAEVKGLACKLANAEHMLQLADERLNSMGIQNRNLQAVVCRRHFDGTPLTAEEMKSGMARVVEDAELTPDGMCAFCGVNPPLPGKTCCADCDTETDEMTEADL